MWNKARYDVKEKPLFDNMKKFIAPIWAFCQHKKSLFNLKKIKSSKPLNHVLADDIHRGTDVLALEIKTLEFCFFKFLSKCKYYSDLLP